MRLSIEERDRAQSMLEYGSRREKLLGRVLLEGMESLTEAERVEFYLYGCKPAKSVDVQALAQRLTEKFGSLADMVFLSPKELMQAGMGRSLAERFTGVGRLAEKFARYERSYRKIYIRSVAELCSYILPLYRSCSYPGTWQLCLNDGYELVYQREICASRAWGEQDAAENSLADAYFSSARYCIIVQMCGREPANPKDYDRKYAKIHAGRLEEIGCRLLDVVLVDEGRIASMYEMGLMDPEGRRIYNHQLYEDEEVRINQ